jgi:hypothetical protein
MSPVMTFSLMRGQNFHHLVTVHFPGRCFRYDNRRNSSLDRSDILCVGMLLEQSLLAGVYALGPETG